MTGSYDPNDKTGFPKGQTENNYISANQQLQYLIRFQNTGTDTAFTVVIRDTLDVDFDIFSVVSGVSSHSYEFKMYGPRVLEWTFNDINLPDSAANQEGSNGFVTFHVEQVRDLAPGTEITNDADIYFDKNAPITTNTTMHRIYEGFVNVLSVEEALATVPGIHVFPNPANDELFVISETQAYAKYTIYDCYGRPVLNGQLNGIESKINIKDLSKGNYYIFTEGVGNANSFIKL